MQRVIWNVIWLCLLSTNSHDNTCERYTQEEEGWIDVPRRKAWNSGTQKNVTELFNPWFAFY